MEPLFRERLRQSQNQNVKQFERIAFRMAGPETLPRGTVLDNVEKLNHQYIVKEILGKYVVHNFGGISVSNSPCIALAAAGAKG
jgi:hypothetical protein